MPYTAKPGECRDKGCTQGEKVVTVAAHCLLNPLTRVKGPGPAAFSARWPSRAAPVPGGALPGTGTMGRNQKPARRAPVSPLLPRPDRTVRGPLRDAGPRGHASLHRGGGRQSQLRRYYYEQRLHRRAGAGVRARAREREGCVHGGAAGRAGAAECGGQGGRDWSRRQAQEDGRKGILKPALDSTFSEGRNRSL